MLATEALRVGRYDSAIAAASRVIADDADDVNAFLVHGTAYVQAGRPSEAIGDLGRSVALAPDLGVGWYNLSLAYDGAGDARAALEAAQRARPAGHPVADAYVGDLTRRGEAPGLGSRAGVESR